MGYCEAGVLAVCAWAERLWDQNGCPNWCLDHADVLDRLGVAVSKVGPRWVVRWTEDQARAFQLLHIFLHELGHHHDRMTTRSERDAPRGEPYAERFALELADEIWDDFLRVFPV
jgi:hypothetical protein